MSQASAEQLQAMNPFEGFDQAEGSGSKGIHLKPGKYKLEINAMKYHIPNAEAKKIGKVPCVITNFTVLCSDNQKLPTGAQPGYVVKDNTAFFFDNLKDLLVPIFVDAATGITREHVNKEVLFACVDPKVQAARGKIVDLIALPNDKMVAAGKPDDFPRLNWQVDGTVYPKGEGANVDATAGDESAA